MPPEYVSIANWSELQHYSDRRPPWIKLYNQLLSDPRYTGLSPANRANFIGLMMLASMWDNKLTTDQEWLQHSLYVKEHVDLDSLLSCGLIETWSASPVLVHRKRGTSKGLVQRQSQSQKQRQSLPPVEESLPSVDSSRSNGTDHDDERKAKLAEEREELRWRVKEVWAAFLAQRELFYSRRNGKAPGRPPELTPDIEKDILRQLRIHDRKLLGADQREEWRLYSKVRASGIGMFVDPWCSGRDEKSPKTFLEPWRPWRSQRGKGDPIERFSQLYFEAKGR